jgi:hypothetical protein
VDQDLLGGGWVVFGGAFDQFSALEAGAGADELDQVGGAFTARQRDWAASMTLNAIANPAAREPGPFVTFVRLRTVAKVDSRRALDPPAHDQPG